MRIWEGSGEKRFLAHLRYYHEFAWREILMSITGNNSAFKPENLQDKPEL
jgi:hypothetical protein